MAIIDPWETTMKPAEGRFQSEFTMRLPGKRYLAVRFRKADWRCRI